MFATALGSEQNRSTSLNRDIPRSSAAKPCKTVTLPARGSIALGTVFGGPSLEGLSCHPTYGFRAGQAAGSCACEVSFFGQRASRVGHFARRRSAPCFPSGDR
eukprot:15484749-Alexandrium_andersonii.AAC.1